MSYLNMCLVLIWESEVSTLMTTYVLLLSIIKYTHHVLNYFF